MLVTFSGGAPRGQSPGTAHHIAKVDTGCAGEDPSALPTLSRRRKDPGGRCWPLSLRWVVPSGGPSLPGPWCPGGTCLSARQRGEHPPQASLALPSQGLLPAAPSLGILCLAWIKSHAPSSCFLELVLPFSAWGQAWTSLKVWPMSRDQNVSTERPPPGPGRYRALTAVSRAARRWSQAGVKCSQQGQIGARRGLRTQWGGVCGHSQEKGRQALDDRREGKWPSRRKKK